MDENQRKLYSKALGIIVIVISIIIGVFAASITYSAIPMAVAVIMFIGGFIIVFLAGEIKEEKYIPKKNVYRSKKMVLMIVLLEAILISAIILVYYYFVSTSIDFIFMDYQLMTVVVVGFIGSSIGIINGYHGIYNGKCYTGWMSDNWSNIWAITTDQRMARKVGKRSLVLGIILFLLTLFYIFSKLYL